MDFSGYDFGVYDTVLRYFVRHAMEDSGDMHSLRSRTDVTAEMNVEARRDADVAYC